MNNLHNKKILILNKKIQKKVPGQILSATTKGPIGPPGPSGTILTSSLDSLTVSKELNIAKNQTSGILNIGTAIRSGNINIGTKQNKNFLNIGSNTNAKTNIYGRSVAILNNTSITGSLITSGNITGNVINSNSITVRHISSNSITTGIGPISCGYINCSSLTTGTGPILSGNINCSSLTTGTGPILSGDINCSSLTTGTGPILSGDINCSSLTTGTGPISGGDIDCKLLTTGTGPISGGDIDCKSLITKIINTPLHDTHLNIAENQTTGVLNIGSSLLRTTGSNINIGNNAIGGNLTLGKTTNEKSTLSGGTVDISSGGALNINSPGLITIGTLGSRTITINGDPKFSNGLTLANGQAITCGNLAYNILPSQIGYTIIGNTTATTVPTAINSQLVNITSETVPIGVYITSWTGVLNGWTEVTQFFTSSGITTNSGGNIISSVETYNVPCPASTTLDTGFTYCGIIKVITPGPLILSGYVNATGPTLRISYSIIRIA